MVWWLLSRSRVKSLHRSVRLPLVLLRPWAVNRRATLWVDRRSGILAEASGSEGGITIGVVTGGCECKVVWFACTGGDGVWTGGVARGAGEEGR